MDSSKNKLEFDGYRIAFTASFLYIILMLFVGIAMSGEVRELIDRNQVIGRGYISLRYIVVIGLSSIIIFLATCIVLKRMNKDKKIIEESLAELKEKEKSIKKASYGLKSQEKLIDNVLESALVFILILDEDLKIKRTTKNIEDITEYREEELRGRCLGSIMNHQYIKTLKKELEDKGSHGLEISLKSKHGKDLYTYGTIRREINSEENKNYYSFIFFDISERKNLEDKIRYLDSYDKLTDLPNRYLAERIFTSRLPELELEGNPVALLYIDID